MKEAEKMASCDKCRFPTVENGYEYCTAQMLPEVKLHITGKPRWRDNLLGLVVDSPYRLCRYVNHSNICHLFEPAAEAEVEAA